MSQTATTAVIDGQEHHVTATPSRRRRRVWVVLSIVVALLLLLLVAAELLLRSLIPGIVADRIRGELGLSSNQEIDVSLGGSAVWNALRGGVGDLTITASNAEFIEGLPLNAEARLGFVPFDPGSGELQDARVTLTVPSDQLGGIIALATDGVATTGEIRDGALVVGKELDLFGTQTSIEASLTVAVSDGNLEITPLGVDVAGLSLDVERLHNATGSLLDPLTQEREVCIKDRLPVGVVLTGLSLSQSTGATFDATINERFFEDEAQRTPGSCS